MEPGGSAGKGRTQQIPGSGNDQKQRGEGQGEPSGPGKIPVGRAGFNKKQNRHADKCPELEAPLIAHLDAQDQGKQQVQKHRPQGDGEEEIAPEALFRGQRAQPPAPAGERHKNQQHRQEPQQLGDREICRIAHVHFRLVQQVVQRAQMIPQTPEGVGQEDEESDSAGQVRARALPPTPVCGMEEQKPKHDQEEKPATVFGKHGDAHAHAQGQPGALASHAQSPVKTQHGQGPGPGQQHIMVQVVGVVVEVDQAFQRQSGEEGLARREQLAPQPPGRPETDADDGVAGQVYSPD